MKTTPFLRTLSALRWGVGAVLALVGLAGVPEDLTTWAGWIGDVRPYISHEIVRTVLVAVGVLLIALPRIVQLANRFLAARPTGEQPASAGPMRSGTSTAGRQSFSDGDWITAAIVAPDRAITAMKKAGAALHDQMSGSRNDVLGQIQAAVDQEVSRLRARFEAGGTTDEARCEACIAKITADLIEREGTSLLYELRQRPDVDPKGAFSRMIKRLGKVG